MDFKQLTSGRFSPGVSSGKSATPLITPTPPYKKDEVDLCRMDEQQGYLPYARQHANKYNVKIVPIFKQALELRAKGEAVLTLREADIAARGEIVLSKDIIQKALQTILGSLVEGIPGEKDNAFALREFYNRGVAFKKNFINSVDLSRRAAAEKAMNETLQRLDDLQIPAWPEEVENGFHVELCKPEFMSWDQYREAARTTIIRDPEFKDES